VDALAATSGRSIVVRFNGGAQAGHTVVTPDGVRHVFSHFGSGALAGAPTYLSHFFVANPRIFLNERVELAKHKANLNVTMNPYCPVTTPWDVMVNRWVETERGKDCHGSVGIGFGETVGRTDKYFLCAADAFRGENGYLRKFVSNLQEWAVDRSAKLGIPLTLGRRDAIYDEGTLETFLQEVTLMRDLVTLGRAQPTISAYETVIFEGAQGLLLDQTHGYKFPHLTRSNTGLQNVLEIAACAGGIDKIDVRYITRAYTTRHGAGPLDGEGTLEGVTVVDETNGDKPWQGPFRTAPLNAARVGHAIQGDLNRARCAIEINPSLVLTCMDQIHGVSANLVEDTVAKKISLPIRYRTTGPSSREVVK